MHGRTPASCLNFPFVTSNEENSSGLLQLRVLQQRGCIRNTGNLGTNYRTASAVCSGKVSGGGEVPLCLGTSEKMGGWNVQLLETPRDEKSLSLQTDLGINKTLHNNPQKKIWRNLIDHFYIKQEKNYQGDVKLSSQDREEIWIQTLA